MFLKKVYQEWKALFVVLLLFISAQFFFMFKGIENAPFFLYSMFSTIHEPADSFPVILMKSTNGYISPFEYSNREAEMLMNNISTFNNFIQRGYKDDIDLTIERRFKKNFSNKTYQFIFNGLSNDSAAVNKYPVWWVNYFNSVSTKKIDSIKVIKSVVYFSPVFKKSAADSIIFSTSFQ